jgi:hypothetical protein
MLLVYLGLPFAVKLPSSFEGEMSNDAPDLDCANSISTDKRKPWNEIIAQNVEPERSDRVGRVWLANGFLCLWINWRVLWRDLECFR